jgi:hypothetical protein
MKSVSDAIKERNKESKRIREVARLTKNVTNSLNKEFAKNKLNIVNLYLSSTSFDFSVTGSKADYHIMYGILRRHGLKPQTNAVLGDTGHCTFWVSETDSNVRVWVSFSSTSCRRVQVGTKTEEVPVYETVCDE